MFKCVCAWCGKVKESKQERPASWLWLLDPDEEHKVLLCGSCARKGERKTMQLLRAYAKKRAAA